MQTHINPSVKALFEMPPFGDEPNEAPVWKAIVYGRCTYPGGCGCTYLNPQTAQTCGTCSHSWSFHTAG